jgi:hypothetical protein
LANDPVTGNGLSNAMKERDSSSGDEQKKQLEREVTEEYMRREVVVP